MSQRSVSRRRIQSRGHLIAIAAMAVVGAGMLGGCQKTLFTQNDERSQYDRHDAARGRLVSPYRFDEYGQQQPNLRGRLLTN